MSSGPFSHTPGWYSLHRFPASRTSLTAVKAKQNCTLRRVLLEHRMTRRAKDFRTDPATLPPSSPTVCECRYTVQSKPAECCMRLTENLGRRSKSCSSRVARTCDEWAALKEEEASKFVEFMSGWDWCCILEWMCIKLSVERMMMAAEVVGTRMRGSRRADVSGEERGSESGREQALSRMSDARFDALAQT